jgi:hypothetical protein
MSELEYQMLLLGGSLVAGGIIWGLMKDISRLRKLVGFYTQRYYMALKDGQMPEFPID